MRASATAAVPFGYICGFPLASQGCSEHWGYVEGQSLLHAQAVAVAAAAARWGGATELPFSVCKTGYKPFDAGGRRMLGCPRHSGVRAERIARAGLRPGWASFDQPEWTPPPLAAAPAGAEECEAAS